MRQDESYGVVPLRFEKERWEVFLIQHNRSGYWGFPKGHAEPNETDMDAAFRELKEETNLDKVTLYKSEPLVEQYTFLIEGERVYKKVSYFIAEVRGDVVLQKQEIHDGKWIAIEKAYHQLTHTEGKMILAQAEKIVNELK